MQVGVTTAVLPSFIISVSKSQVVVHHCGAIASYLLFQLH